VHSRKNKVSPKVSRRTFIAAMASLPVLSLPWTSASAASFKPFSFVYVSDVHLTTGVPDESFKLLQESQLFLQDTIKSINALKPDFVIFGGDQVETIGAKSDENWQLFIDLVQLLDARWTFVLGEQDVSGKNPIDKMKVFGLDLKGRGITTSEPYWSIDPVEAVHLIGLDTSQSNSPTGDISSQQLEWLKKDLAANKDKFTIVASHHPLLPPPPYDGGPPLDDYIVPNGSDVREIIGNSPDVRLVLSGHLYLNKVQLERDTYHISCAGLNIYPCQLKYFKVGKDSVMMESYVVPFGQLVKKSLKALSASAFATKVNRRNPEKIVELCDGSPEDQNALLSLSSTKSVQELSKKQLKEDRQKHDEELDKISELARNQGKTKGKKGQQDEDKAEKETPENKTNSSSQDDVAGQKKTRVGKSKKHDARDAVPDSKDAVPDSKNAVPSSKDAVPDSKSSAPSSKDAAPD
jgi:3',5'-cyclic AMP phosphodiesterase CpdA